MQRIARRFAALILVFAVGCQAPAEKRLDRVPDPLLSTGKQAEPPPPPPPPPPREEPAPKLQQKPAPPSDTAFERTRMIPPGGIQRNRWKVIVVHHSATAKATPQGMAAYHRQRGWSGLGYHFVIGNGVNYPDGQIFVGERWKEQRTGAHCKAGAGSYFGIFRPNNFFNEHGIGICLIGDFESGRPTRRQLSSLQQLIEFLCREGGINPAQVYGHGQVTRGGTKCPGRNIGAQLAEMKQTVRQRLALADALVPAIALGQDGYSAALAYVQLHLAVLRGDRLPELFDPFDQLLADALDHVAWLKTGALVRAALVHAYDQAAAHGWIQPELFARLFADLAHMQAAPGECLSAHHADALGFTPLDLDALEDALAVASDR